MHLVEKLENIQSDLSSKTTNCLLKLDLSSKKAFLNKAIRPTNIFEFSSKLSSWLLTPRQTFLSQPVQRITKTNRSKPNFNHRRIDLRKVRKDSHGWDLLFRSRSELNYFFLAITFRAWEGR